MTVTIHLKGGVKQTYLETAVLDDVDARWCILASGVTTGNRRNLQGRERNHYGFAEDSHIAYDWRMLTVLRLHGKAPQGGEIRRGD